MKFIPVLDGANRAIFINCASVATFTAKPGMPAYTQVTYVVGDTKSYATYEGTADELVALLASE